MAVGAAALAVAVRISGALHYAFWQDEIASARIIMQATPIGVARHVAQTESTPPAFYAIGWLFHTVGFSMPAVRILSVLTGAGLAAAVAVYARTLLLPLWASALSALGVALGYQFVFHGRELRAYELYALLAVGLALAIQEVAIRPDRRRLVVLAAVVALGTLTNYFYLLFVATAVVWIWRWPGAPGVRRRALVTVGCGLIPFVFWSPVLVFQYAHHRVAHIGPFDGSQVLTTYWQMFAHSVPDAEPLHTGAPLLLVAAVVAGCVILARRSRFGQLCALLALAPFVVGALVWLAGPRVYDVRNMIGTGPFVAVALAALVAALPRWAAVGAGTVAAALVVAAFAEGQGVTPVPYDRVAQALAAQGWSPRDPIVLFGNFFAYRGPLEWYLPGRPPLTLGDPAGGACSPIFVVGSRAAARQAGLRTAELQSSRHIGTLFAGRLRPDARIGDRRWHAARLMVATRGHAACVRAVPENRLRARLLTSR